ncbi:hypothetical protein GCM10022403_034130 [Streptomyces coacervatus]|uniref:Uncharacterized protein n=1 Tax=Streptomyces coacervatus TaxID=647381 RepID=A0ABP7HLV3_9ACTN|nr:hypothetical protein [Streptomyces coacervatus]MDF2272109.1 hypothetical protein [Streptomyces coacervatus]
MVLRRRRDKKLRLTGISVSLTGASLSWDTVQAEQGRARQILHRLEDHRVLYNPLMYEVVGVEESIEKLRAYLGEQIPQCESVELRDEVREIQAALRQCLTDSSLGNNVGGAWARHDNLPAARYAIPLVAQALGVMRARVGAAVAEIASLFDIPVDGDLARIVPQDLGDAESDDPPSIYRDVDMPPGTGPRQ